MPGTGLDPDVDAYVATSRLWPAEMTVLRPVLVGAGLDEAIKWRKPCYSIDDGANICILQEMKDHLSVMFFKGALLDDPAGVLVDQGPNSRSAKRICITSVDDAERLAPTIAEYAAAAIEVERSGAEVGPAPEPEYVEELVQRLDRDPAFREAFEALTPGRRREYHLHISGAKKSATREARIDKYAPKILAGKGMRDR